MAKHANYRFRRTIAALLGLAALVSAIVANPNSYEPASTADSSSETVEATKDETSADSTLAVDVLESLAVREKNTSEKYYRKLFYDSWGKDSNGCSTRDVILKRDLTDTVLDGCKVMSGKLQDPYTGKTIDFVRGQDTSSAVQIDHVVALSNAWATGAYAFDEGTRYEMSQDPLNLLAVDGPANNEKSDQDASEWLPSNTAFQCQYVARQISVKAKYHLWVTPTEKSKMKQVLSNCSDESTVGLESQ